MGTTGRSVRTARRVPPVLRAPAGRAGALGGYLWEFVSPEVAFTVAAAIGVVGTGYFLLYGEEFEASA